MKNTFKFKPEDNPFNIGDVVPYKNTRGNIREASISSFEVVDNGDTWFHGINTITGAKVWYPLHLSLKFKSEIVEL